MSALCLWFAPGGRGYLVFGRIHMLDLRFGRPTHPSTKTLCPDPSIYQICCQFLLLNSSIYQNLTLKLIHLQFFANFCSWTHLSTKILRSNPSIYQNFTLFLENDPPIYLHQPFKTHPSTSSIRIHENMWVPPLFPGICSSNSNVLPTITWLRKTLEKWRVLAWVFRNTDMMMKHGLVLMTIFSKTCGFESKILINGGLYQK